MVCLQVTVFCDFSSDLLHGRHMLHDENHYHEPFKFKPERFLYEGGRLPESDPRPVFFGFGRRYVLRNIKPC